MNLALWRIMVEPHEPFMVFMRVMIFFTFDDFVEDMDYDGMMRMVIWLWMAPKMRSSLQSCNAT